jgi:predicted TPR repeat methyltransferase/predicted negative regulator of RcsB-dependent stress response
MLTLPQAIQLAIQHHQAGHLLKAEAIYQQVLQIQPRHPDALHLLGLTNHQMGKNDQAYALISKAISINPLAATFHNNLGEVCRAMNRLDEAHACYKKALSLQPDFPEALRNIGLTHLANGQPDQAVAHLHNATARYPGYLGMYWALGQALMSQHKADEAIAAYDQGLARSPLDPTLLCAKGVALLAAGKQDDSIQHYLQAIDKQPDVHEFHLNLALIYQEQRNAANAITCLERVIELKPNAEIARHMLAALQNITPDRAPASYVRKIFDDYADKFDKHLVEKLDYHTPGLIAGIVRKQLGAECHAIDTLDLGCGTGLFGEQIKDLKKRLVGVDLAPRMVDKARERGIYDQLIVGDLLEYLTGTQTDQFDLVAATDVFNYVGNLLPVFEQVSRILTPGGWFTFSIEAAPDSASEFVLDKTGRYQHHKNYLERLGIQFGFAQAHFSEAVLRQEHGNPVSGYIYLFQTTLR